jgi:tRNA pseudouridine55 synthase
VITSGIDFGTEVWVSHGGLAIAVGRYMGGEVHPERVFNRGGA